MLRAVGRGHHELWIIGSDSLQKFAGLSIARNDCSSFRPCLCRFLKAVESQVRMSLFFVGTMADEAPIRKNRANISSVSNGLKRQSAQRRRQNKNCENDPRNNQSKDGQAISQHRSKVYERSPEFSLRSWVFRVGWRIQCGSVTRASKYVRSVHKILSEFHWEAQFLEAEANPWE